MGKRVAFTAALLAGLLAAPAASPAGSLPSATSGHRPGPDALYAPPPRAPQLENTGPWRAEPILVSGAVAYRDGELLYQDFLYDDRGAGGVPDPSDPMDPGSFTFSPTTGSLTYPTDPVYANNAADLVELRVKPLADATAIRVTLNTMRDPERAAFTIALGGGGGAARAWPHGAGVRSPADRFLTVHGATAELLDATTGLPIGGVSARVDLTRRQVDVRIPHRVWDPGRAKVRMSAGTGLWDPAAGRYLQPGATASATTPGGGVGGPGGRGGRANITPALFNLAFRTDEPKPDITQFGAGVTIGDAAVGAKVEGAWWREKAQAEALRLGDAGRFWLDVDFGKLAARTNDESGVPRTGPINRILASAHSPGQGVDHSKVCFDLATDGLAGGGSASDCEGRMVGQLQPYALYVPERKAPRRGWGMTLLLHSLSANYNQYTASKNQSQLGERGAGSLVATPAGRGPDGFYAGLAEADTFEVWADVARHYRLDPGWSVVSGYSMGGFGTYRLLARWPDLFARGWSVVGIPGSADDQLESLRNTPLMTWAAVADELVHVDQTEEATRRLGELGLRFISDLFPAADHLTLATADEYGPGAAWLGEHRVDRAPAHVTYVVDPTEDSARGGVVADHAYWLSGLKVRDPQASPTATVDARTLARGRGDAKPSGVAQGGGVVEGGSRGPQPYVRRSQSWGPAPRERKADRLVLHARNLAAVTIDARRAGLSCSPQVDVESDGPVDVRIDCAGAEKGKRRR